MNLLKQTKKKKKVCAAVYGAVHFLTEMNDNNSAMYHMR